MPILNTICPVCTERFQNGEDIYSTICGHIFHFACLNQWRSRGTSCPQCRQHDPTSHKLYLSFEETDENLQELEVMRLKLQTSNDKITDILVQKNEAEANFMKLQEQFTMSENSKIELEIQMMEINDYQNDFYRIQAQYTESSNLVKEMEDRLQQLFIENESISKELRLKTLENDSLTASLEALQNSMPESALSSKIDILEKKLKNMSKEFEKEINTNTQLSIEKMKLESYIKHMNSTKSTERLDKICKNSNSAQRSENARRDNGSKISGKNKSHNNSIYIKNLPLNQITSPLENIVIDLATKMKLTISPDDLIKVNLKKSDQENFSTAMLFAQFENSTLRTKFLSNKNILKNYPETQSIIIQGDYMEDNVYLLYMYAKEKLLNNGFHHIFNKNNKIFAKKFGKHPVVRIQGKAHVDNLYAENILRTKAEVPKKNDNIDENLYKL